MSGLRTIALCLLFACFVPAADGVVELWFFHAPGCRGCNAAKAAVNALERSRGAAVRVVRLDTTDPAEGSARVRRLFALLDAHGQQGATPELAVFVGDEACYGADAIVDGIDAAVDAALAAGWTGPPLGADAPTGGGSDRLTLAAVSVAALADGINPCAFATIVLLVGFLAVARRSRREIALVGATFAAGVFVAYLLLGLAIFAVLKQLSGFHVVSDLVYLAAFGLCLLGAALCLWDASLALRGRRPGEMLLKLPDRVRNALHAQMRRGLRRRLLVGGVFVTGLVVAVLESVCTGQVYLPVIAGLVRGGGGFWQGLTLLLWYCALFILPLLVVLGLAIAGLRQERLVSFGNRHWGLLKVLLALAFGLMAAWMVAGGLPWPPGNRERATTTDQTPPPRQTAEAPRGIAARVSPPGA